MADSNTRPIIVIKKKGGHGGHHGGAWKVAYADFVTAMMSLFIVLWLMGSSVKVKKAVAGYFNDPKGTGQLLGTTMAGTGQGTIEVKDDQKALEELKEKLEKQIKDKKELDKLMKQIEMTITSEGLRIELIEDKNGTFYQSGSPKLSSNGQELLTLLAAGLKTIPNNLLIEGHTDAAPYSNDNNYSNWELSADRANAARRILQQSGVRQDQVTQVRGYADQMLRVKNNPYDPSNRRISILVKNADPDLAQKLKNTRVANEPPPPPAAKPEVGKDAGKTAAAANPAANAAKPAAPAAPQQAAKPATPPAAQPAAKPGLMGKLTSMLPGKKK
ncbi:flagellar motor protein MotB [Telmatobacter bradus]|uniref:flagellar motor protein MotB n=1 Tax=Telmatobacter bradus TaxID=474953 RepID=UPI003B428CC4